MPADEDDTRLDRYLRRLVPGLTQGPVEKMLRSGLIRLDGAKAKPATRLAAGQQLRMPPHLRDAPVHDASVSDAGLRPVTATPQLRGQFAEMVVAEGADGRHQQPSGLAVQGGSGMTRQDGMLQALADGGMTECGLFIASTRIPRVCCCWPVTE